MTAENGDFVVSGRNLFPLVQERLARGEAVRFTVSGNSMWPLLLHNRDSVLLTACGADTLRKGDLILFQPFPGKFVLHRITEAVPGGFVTTGDGNLHRDGVIPAEAVLARAAVLYRKGRKIDCASGLWRAVFRLWMALFPLRGPLLRLLYAAARWRGTRGQRKRTDDV